MKINNKVLAMAMSICLPVSMIIASCVSGYTPATSPGYANPSGECDSTCVSDTPPVDGYCGASVGVGVSGHECSITLVPYSYTEYEPRMHWDPFEEEWYCTCDVVYWALDWYSVPHIGFLCKGKKPLPIDPIDN
jgi:hypothetical protein